MPNMSDSPQENKAPEATPEQLMKMLDLQIAATRHRREQSPARRATFLAMALLLIIGGALVAFLVLQQMISDLPRQSRTFEKAERPSASH